jgi:hypothetical protein
VRPQCRYALAASTQKTQICRVSPMPTAAATPTAESDVLVDERSARARAAKGIERPGATICLLAVLPPKVGRQTAMRRPAAQREWRFNASCLVKRSAACTHPTGTVLAVPQIRVRPRSNSRSPRVRIEMQAAGVAGAEEHRRHPDAKANGTDRGHVQRGGV